MMKRLALCFLAAALTIFTAMGEDDGYFLSFSQKGQLIGTGRIKDSDGLIYDVRICPGYKYPVRRGWRKLKKAGGNMGEYFSADKYEDMFDASGEALEWGVDDCLMDFAIKGSGKAWKRNFSRANGRVKKRVFGWWMAYPWAFMKSSVDNVVRIPVGLTGSVIGVGAGVVVVPAYCMTDSTVKAVWNGGVEGVLVPAAGVTWNTVIAPPLAIVGQKPAESRVDGFWVRIIPAEYGMGSSLGDKDIEKLAELGVLLRSEQKRFDDERGVIDKESKARIKILNDEIRKLKAEKRVQLSKLTEKERFAMEAFRKSNEIKEFQAGLRGYAWSKSEIRRRQNLIKEKLVKDHDLTPSEAWKVVTILIRHSAFIITLTGDLPEDLQRRPEKLNPLTESIETIKEIK